MAETTEKVKKAKAPAKPKATASETATTKKAAPKKAAAKKEAPKVPTHEEISRLAEHYWNERGRQDGQAEQDWLRAEQELSKAS